jgi:phospholipid/cholesterol/gamma-HCH transport system substrate-binding protein
VPREKLVTVVKRRLYGLLFLALVASLITLSIAIYNKAFTPTVDVTLRAAHTGNELLLDSDVKERGIIVGSVKAVRSNGSQAVVTLALDPGSVHSIPANVSAQILPKTLFGEQYVSLDLPDGVDPNDVPNPIKAGDVIPENRSKGALESQKVLGDLLPLLTAVQPAQLNDTLNAVATALQGRGEELGRTLVDFDKYLRIINPHTRKLVDDLHQLGKVALEYNDVAPDIFATLRNLQTSARTVIDKRVQFDSLLGVGSSASNVLAGFLAQNKQRLIDITGQTDKLYALLKQYSPEYPCVFAGVTKLDTLANQAISNHSINLSLTPDLTNDGPYRPGNQPTLITGYGPQCFGLPNAPDPFEIPGKYRCVNDGAPLTADPCADRPGVPGTSPPVRLPGLPKSKSPLPLAAQQDAAAHELNSPGENALVDTLIAGRLRTTPDKVPGTDTLLAAPLLRGNQVVIK